ncbi:male sterility protein-domain-containing protein [Radiomyces spectabilis]|uniref:male sterility protein-domain-containing protein n=1 Tax=Radiomyces spectabilis TaxID=64574 RepID=UPI00221F06D7|nr:male sterility protein-domain-containing protein [Radiomyces spectabilis]KAI8381317.1 male sterility protein-domain-containing protein [Radiomyces spectabilis]
MGETAPAEKNQSDDVESKSVTDHDPEVKKSETAGSPTEVPVAQEPKDSNAEEPPVDTAKDAVPVPTIQISPVDDHHDHYFENELADCSITQDEEEQTPIPKDTTPLPLPIEEHDSTAKSDTADPLPSAARAGSERETDHAQPTDPSRQSPVNDFYHNKNILLTGATGFVGKAVLWKLIQSVGQDVGKIYILIRNGSNKRSKVGRPTDRFFSEIISSKAFMTLKRQLGSYYFQKIIDKVVPVTGDIISPDLSMMEEDRQMIIDNVNVVIHCAATLDYHERLDLALETNTLGTLRLMDLADECRNLDVFVHMSTAYFNANLPDGYVQERVYPMELGDPEELLKEIVALELQDIPKMTQRVLAYYPNTYTFTKSLTEHLILKRVDYNRLEEAQGGKNQWPVAIVRATQVGAGCFEPLPGWMDGISGTNAAVYLLGHGIHALPSDIGDLTADIVPVDYLAKVIIGCPIRLMPPGIKFILPYNEILHDEDDHTASIAVPQIQYFPIIYQLSATAITSITWRQMYEAVRHYWNRNSRVNLPPGRQYFMNNKALHRAKTFMRSRLPQSLTSVTTVITNNNPISKRFSDPNLSNRAIELASRAVEANHPFVRHRWTFDHQNVDVVRGQLQADPLFNLDMYQTIDWETYMLSYSFNTHLFISQGAVGLRNITLPAGWDCAMYSKLPDVRNSIIDKQIESVIFSAADINKRTDRMLAQVTDCLEHPGLDTRDKKKAEEWVNDFDASLDDWCHDDSEILKDGRRMADLGRWSSQSRDHDEALRVVVLNDPRVGHSIRQIIETSGVPQQTVVGEAYKILQRMRERTQLEYVWFAGAFLDALFKRLFMSIRICEEDLAKLKQQIQGKNVVYMPVSKTMMDQLLIWYICLRYHLPVPAIVCDEALALLGPISDIMRIAGAFFVRRDQKTRSPLNTAVTAAYTEALLNEHGALSMLIEKTRSRTGRVQSAYPDGMIEMILDASLEKGSKTPTQDPYSPPASPAPSTESGSNHRNVTFVPINITYEKIPELRTLIDQVLDQKPRETSTTLASSLLRPSASVADRAANKDNGAVEQGKYGRVFVSFGESLSLQDVIEATGPCSTSNLKDASAHRKEAMADYIAKAVQRKQHEATIVSPVALVAATVLFGRAINGISMGKIYELVGWLRHEICYQYKMKLDWEEEEDVQTIVAYALNFLDARTNIIYDSKRITDNTKVRVVEHADNVMDLSYMASQLIEIFLPKAILAVVYLSAAPLEITRNELYDQFAFLVRLFKDEFIYPWNVEETFQCVLDQFVFQGILVAVEEDKYKKAVTSDTDEHVFTQLCLLASFLYPILDAYWITSCSLSALRDLPFMPRKIVPILAQWIAAHLISGRRTIYREVLSTEASQNAVDNFLAIGFIDAVHPKSHLSPDAQILLLELGITTNEDLVMVAQRSDVPAAVTNTTPDNVNSLSRLKDIASLCHEIEKYRFGANIQPANYQQNAQVFDKCQNQIRSILRAEKSYASQHGMNLMRAEDQMIQLVYSLKMAASSTAASGEAGRRNPRRVSEVYHLRST